MPAKNGLKALQKMISVYTAFDADQRLWEWTCQRSVGNRQQNRSTVTLRQIPAIRPQTDNAL
ncbi:hypothetical protein AO286_25625 [Pseudomonas syringae]|nr:hypothetical protein AL046_00030 [Pseudomonas syringae pv. avii]PHN58541.1 hypothetical protein AO286_25625 [Pseudomonas syringae]POQ06967.1 hypothetical protein CXB40_17910 [Pseudomonas syringae pv. avii]